MTNLLTVKSVDSSYNEYVLNCPRHVQPTLLGVYLPDCKKCEFHKSYVGVHVHCCLPYRTVKDRRVCQNDTCPIMCVMQTKL